MALLHGAASLIPHAGDLRRRRPPLLRCSCRRSQPATATAPAKPNQAAMRRQRMPRNGAATEAAADGAAVPSPPPAAAAAAAACPLPAAAAAAAAPLDFFAAAVASLPRRSAAELLALAEAWRLQEDAVRTPFAVLQALALAAHAAAVLSPPAAGGGEQQPPAAPDAYAQAMQTHGK